MPPINELQFSGRLIAGDTLYFLIDQGYLYRCHPIVALR